MRNNASGLSDAGLAWMTAELSALGGAFAADPAYVPHPDPRGLLHEPWRQPPWALVASAPRAFPAGLALHRSIPQRLEGGPLLTELGTVPEPYDPHSLAGYVVGGQIVAGVRLVG